MLLFESWWNRWWQIIKCFVGLSLLIKFMMWGYSLRLWTVPYLNFGRIWAVKYADGVRCCHALNLSRTSLLGSAVDTVTLLGGLKAPAATKAQSFSPPSTLFKLLKSVSEWPIKILSSRAPVDTLCGILVLIAVIVLTLLEPLREYQSLREGKLLSILH